jgi:hypothetical protein
VRIWLWFLVCAVVASALAAALSPGGSGWPNLLVLAGSIAAAVVGLRRHRPEPAAAWWLLLAGAGASATSTLAAALLPDGPPALRSGYCGPESTRGSTRSCRRC